MKVRISGFLRRKRLIAVFLMVIVAAFFFLRSRNGNGKLEVALVERGIVQEELLLTGEVKAREYSALQFNTPGTISWVGVKVGDKVKRGQALMKLDTTRLNSAYQIARANYRAAEANAQEVLDALKNKDSDETFSEKNMRTAAEAARDRAWDALLSAQKDLSDATLIAPFDGVVTILNSESPGVNIMAGVPQVILVNPESMYFEVSADQTEVSMLKPGAKAEVIIDAFPDDLVSATVTFVSIAPDTTEAGTVYPVRLLLEGDTLKYRIAMAGDAKFVVSQRSDVLYVPSGFVNSDSKGSYVLTEGGKNKKYVVVGIEGEDRTEIKEGIDVGEEVFD